jgi:hypothetical protein
MEEVQRILRAVAGARERFRFRISSFSPSPAEGQLAPMVRWQGENLFEPV